MSLLALCVLGTSSCGGSAGSSEWKTDATSITIDGDKTYTASTYEYLWYKETDGLLIRYKTKINNTWDTIQTIERKYVNCSYWIVRVIPEASNS